MPERMDSVGLLQQILTTIIWICGPLHSMLNFSQWDYELDPENETVG